MESFLFLLRLILGALVVVSAGGKVLKRPVLSSSSFACASDAAVHFGLGKSRQVDSISVRWSDGSRELFDTAGVDRLLEVRQGKGRQKN